MKESIAAPDLNEALDLEATRIRVSLRGRCIVGVGPSSAPAERARDRFCPATPPAQRGSAAVDGNRELSMAGRGVFLGNSQTSSKCQDHSGRCLFDLFYAPLYVIWPFARLPFCSSTPPPSHFLFLTLLTSQHGSGL